MQKFFPLLVFLAAMVSTAVTVAEAPPEDPFADLEPAPTTGKPTDLSPAATGPAATDREPWWKRSTLFRSEIFSQFAVSDVTRPTSEGANDLYSRQSLGFEIQRRFESKVSTLGSCDLQARLVRRDSFLPLINDMEGADRDGWYLEYHNAYCDIFNPLGAVLPERDASALIGVTNLRIGHFYLPLGLNLRTDTHGTVLQLSNDQNLGFERDWFIGLWGGLGRYLAYDLSYLVGSGYDLKYEGQSGMIGARIGTSALVQNESGVEAGIAMLGGERLAELEHGTGEGSDDARPTETYRYGPDLRLTLPTAVGNVILTNEVNGGLDEGRQVFVDLHQIGYLHRSRQYGANLQFRRLWREKASAVDRDEVSSSIFWDLTYYLSNDLGNSHLHWINLNLEQKLENTGEKTGNILSVQYYRYW